MGYDLKVIAGEVSGSPEKDGTKYMSVVSIFDLCVVPPIAELKSALEGKGGKVLNRNESLEMIPIHYYEGGKKITQDKYDAPMLAFDPDILLEALKDAYAKENYRRYPPAIALLESLIANFGTFHVALYGH